MSREFKCRVFWNGEMLFSYNGDFIVYNGEPRLNEYGDLIGMTGCSDLMIFSGLFDKNNKEGCEGDIVKCEDGVNRQLIYANGCFGFKGAISIIVHQGQYNFSRFEIIGNICQHPKLLAIKE